MIKSHHYRRFHLLVIGRVIRAWSPTFIVLLFCGAFVGVVISANPGTGPETVLVSGMDYMGNASCAGSGCHTLDADQEEPADFGGQMIGDENDIWAESDPHRFGFKTLSSDASVAMGKKLNMTDVAADARCLACHATNPAQSHRGELFSLKDAVSCEACHGPGEKWLSPHVEEHTLEEESWTAKQRTAGAPGSAKYLLSKFGLRDTSDLEVRANMCVACHLQIDQDMIDAGHPPFEFEMYAYNYYVSKKEDAEYAVHWDDTLRGVEVDARLWAVGQAAAFAVTKGQVQVYKIGAAIAKKHFGTDLAKAKISASAAGKAAVELAAAAEGAKTPTARRVIAHGVVALSSSSLSIADKEAPDELWNAWEEALGAVDQGGDAYIKAIATMAGAAAK